MIRILLTVFLSLICAIPSMAQLYFTQYRLPEQNWMEIETERFRVIYPERYRPLAERALLILEAEYDDIQQLIGGNLRAFPFIINPENDLSNGFVTPFNFRSEVELAPIKGKALNPQSGDWLESVLPHELVHALHFSVNPPAATRLIGLFSPDAMRSLHAAAPLGFLEGFAVYHESHGSVPHSGRGNYPYFNNQFTALLNSDQEWSMGQLVHISDFTPPFNRHYIGGYRFTNWLINEFGKDSIKRSVQFHYWYPFLGFGVALRHTTGKWPKQLYRAFNEHEKTSEASRIEILPNNTDRLSTEIPFGASCRRMHRPLWLDDTTLLFYGLSCNNPRGFYRYRLEDDNPELFKEIAITEDFHYSFSPDKEYLYFSRYHPDLLYDNLMRSDLHRLELSSGRLERLTRKKRLFSPEAAGDKLLALQTDAHQLNLVVLDPAGENTLQTQPRVENSTVVQVAAHPVLQNRYAVIGNRRGVQALWLTTLRPDEVLFQNPPDVVFQNGSVFDASWHPDGSRLLFVSDHTGTMNIYEYHPETDIINQVTDSRYNAFEPSYSPDGKTIAYIRQVENEQRLFTLPVSDTLHQPIPEAVWRYNSITAARFSMPLMNRDGIPDQENWVHKKYQTGLSWIKPRTWIPTFEREGGFDRIGLTLESTDLMSRHSYSLDVNNYIDRIWYDLDYRYTGFYPGFQLNLFNEPVLTFFRAQQNGEEFTASLLQQARGASIKIPVRLRLESNTRHTSVLLEPQYFFSQIRFLNPDHSSQAYSEFGSRHTVGFRTVFNLNVRQFTRDVQPNSGWVFFAETRYGLNSGELEINTGEAQILANLSQRKGFRGGAAAFISPLSRWNQSLRVTVQAVTQTDAPVFNVFSLYSDHFSDLPYAGANHLGFLDTRYTIPLTYPDDGGLLLPVYLSNMYLVLFSQTVADLSQASSATSLIGAGLRSRFRLGNLAFDIGVSVGWEPGRNQVTWHANSF